MRAVVQRVSRARVSVEGVTEGEIGKGLLVFLGVEKEDCERDICYLADKIAGLRIFEDESGRMNLSLLDVGGELLIVSQFTLYGDCRKGKRPSYDRAASPQAANEIYESFVGYCRRYPVKLETGKFQAHMEVDICNDGPVTIMLDSRKEF
ncbi:D-tyrosyl-tRNA(Tyr) deacylase [Anaerobacterium chartisolvens]|uniref:D-aminoacyl-tRNA deacylase n=1 Tax=Anaerobacterium chartisolvens TaxID=1297424 RepID=A0A369B8V5_9FIRM|nr:D-aminoacyl-tRNA deacylase [Anaerobacterium chartisolvens]RCX17962.1 D-tyrosyl-tRNA(Tyr) deacylase [Anaerobacterium chartisolvens]